MSKKQRLLMGLPSDSEGESDSSGSSVSEPEEAEDSEQDEGLATANASQVSLPAPTLPRSQSTASIVSESNLSVSGGPAQADNVEDKLSKFDKRFKTATSTDEEVLSKLFRFFLLVINLDQLVGRAPDCNLDLCRLQALQNAPDYHRQKGHCCLHLHLHCVRILIQMLVDFPG